MILKAQGGSAGGRGTLRKVLVVSQFAISIVLIIATLITFQQLDYMNRRDLGYARDQVVTLRYFGDELGARYDAFYTELTRGTAIRNASRSSIVPTGRLLDSQGTRVQKGDTLAATDIVIKDVRVDPEFFDTYGVPLVSGRNFSGDIRSDDSLAFVINEAACRMIGWTADEAIGKVFANGSVQGQVIGVVRDFHFESLHEEIVPVVFHLQPMYRRLSVRIATTDLQEGIRQLEAAWREFLPERPFEYTFLSDQYHELYESESKQSQLFMLFAGIAIFIASLGLLGLATFNALQRTREIGIRKVMGASAASIVKLLSTEIVIMILLANLIAWPVAWYFTSEWLEGFAYRVQMSWVVYSIGALAALAIGVITVSSQTIRAATTNPAVTLRNE
jgi:putative ABC transport system permease protein